MMTLGSGNEHLSCISETMSLNYWLCHPGLQKFKFKSKHHPSISLTDFYPKTQAISNRGAKNNIL